MKANKVSPIRERSDETNLPAPVQIAPEDLERVAAGAAESMTAGCGTGGGVTCGKQMQEK
jgi:hypothetical protein